MPDPKAAEELFHMRMDNEKLRAENERLRTENRNLRSDKKEGLNTEIKEKYVSAMRALALKEKQLMKVLGDLEYVREQREALKEVNKEQAERIRELKEKRQYYKHEYEPTKKDIAFINNHIDLFLEEDIIDYYELKKKDYYEEDFIP